MRVKQELSLRKVAWWMIIILITLLMLPNFLWLYVGKNPDPITDVVILPTFLLVIFFALLGKRLWLACLLLAPFAALAPLEIAYINAYLQPTDAITIAMLVVTNPREILEYLGKALIPLLVCVLAGVLIALVAAKLSWRARIAWSHRSRVWISALAFFLIPGIFAFSLFNAPGNLSARMHDGVDSLYFMRFPIMSGYPFGLFARYEQYRHDWRKMREGFELLSKFRFEAHRLNTTAKREIYVLVIGESSRRENWQLFGYDRATNPELSQASNLVPIPNMVSSWPASIMAIPMILTRKPITENGAGWSEPSILRAMGEAGFDTYWVSNQLAISHADSEISSYAYEAQHTVFMNPVSWAQSGNYDEILLRGLRDIIKSSDHSQFIILHTMGSHLSYDYRYPESFKRFRPAQSDHEGSYYDRALNSYDNSILYTDHVLASAIDILHDTGAISSLLFESDHGENLPTKTCLMSGHGYGTRYDFQIPAFVWYSEAYSNAFPTRVAALRKNAGEPALSHDTFESLVDMAGVDFPGHDTSLSLFSPNWRFIPRIVSDLKFRQVDIDNADFEPACQTVLRRSKN